MGLWTITRGLTHGGAGKLHQSKEPKCDRINHKVITIRQSATKYSVDFRNVVACQED